MENQKQTSSRLSLLNQHISSVPTSTSINRVGPILEDGGHQYYEVVDKTSDMKTKLDYINPQGWGYKDTAFIYDDKTELVKLSGHRYALSETPLPHFKAFIDKYIMLDKKSPAQDDMEIQPSVYNHDFLQELGETNSSRRSFKKWERIIHSCGAALMEVFMLRYGTFPRFCDVVVYPESTEQVENLIKLANKHNVVLVPYGGGTNVTQSLMLEEKEKRMIVSVDMTRMRKMLWIDQRSNMCCFQAGIIGVDLEKELKNYGFMLGHEPDSVEFSTLGGWVSTRASGMKKNVYGNIEDIVQNITFCTSIGKLEKKNEWPRISNGPDQNHVIMGQEGNFGIVCEVVMRIRPLPELKKFGSIIFPDFQKGIQFMDDMAKTRVWPASIRLVDNTQFKFGQSLKPQSKSRVADVIDMIKKYYVLNIKGFEQDKMAAVTMAFEGSAKAVAEQEKVVYDVSQKYGGMAAGPENGERGYFLTFTIAYLRDLSLLYNFISESFETSVPWANVTTLVQNVTKQTNESCRSRGVDLERVFVSFRVTQLYETGAAVYVYFGFNYTGMDTSTIVQQYEEIEHECREEIMRNGGSLSHHHGVGKIRKAFVKKTMEPAGMELYKGIKKSMDPKNIFAANNFIDND